MSGLTTTQLIGLLSLGKYWSEVQIPLRDSKARILSRRGCFRNGSSEAKYDQLRLGPSI